MGVTVTNVQSIEWMMTKLKDKFMCWKSRSWLFHVRLEVVQCIMEPMIIFFVIITVEQ